MHPNPTPRLSALARLAAAAAATGVTLTLGAALLGAFNASSPPRWLQASPEVLADLARCDVRRDRAVREQCRQQVALHGLEPAGSTLRLAGAEQLPNGALPGRP